MPATDAHGFEADGLVRGDALIAMTNASMEPRTIRAPDPGATAQRLGRRSAVRSDVT